MGKLIGKTYAATAPSAVAPAAAMQPSAVFACPHCGKEYKTEKGLADQLEAWAALDAKTQAGAVASENVDGYSVSWRDGGTPAAMRADRQSVLSGICSDYLTYPENLMYTGVWRP